MATDSRPTKASHGERSRRRPPGQAAETGKRRTFSRLAFYAHLWIGVVFTVALVIIAISGILLNHKRVLGLMPDVPNEPSRPFSASLSLAELGAIALREVAPPGERPGTVADIDRMDVRPRDGLAKIRMRNEASTEVTVDLGTGKVLHVGRRGDVFLEKLHSGEIFGGRGVLLSDFAAIALAITLLTGYWLWLAPKLRRAGERAGGREEGAA